MHQVTLRILYLEDLASDMELVERVLTKNMSDFELCTVSDKAAYINALSEFKPDIILTDHSLPTLDSLEALKIAKNIDPLIPVILVTSTISEEYAVEIMKAGSSDYILKDRLQRLPAAILNAVEKCKIEKERRRYLDEVIASEALMKEVEYLAGIGSLEIDCVSDTSKWSDETFRILGYRPGEVKPSMDNLIKFVHPDELLYVEKTIKNAIRSLDSLQMHFRIKDSDGAIKYIWLELVVDRDEMNKPSIVTGFLQDITESKANEGKLKESEERYAAVLDSLNLGVCWISSDGTILNANETFYNLIGYSSPGIEGLPFTELECFKPATSGLSFEHILKDVNTNFKTELTLANSSNGYSQAELKISCARSKGNSLRYFVGILRSLSS